MFRTGSLQRTSDEFVIALSNLNSSSPMVLPGIKSSSSSTKQFSGGSGSANGVVNEGHYQNGVGSNSPFPHQIYELSKKEEGFSGRWKEEGFSVHLIPVLLITCCFILWLFSNSQDMTLVNSIKEKSLSGTNATKLVGKEMAEEFPIGGVSDNQVLADDDGRNQSDEVQEELAHGAELVQQDKQIMETIGEKQDAFVDNVNEQELRQVSVDKADGNSEPSEEREMNA